ncbi:hypothetical protein [Arthrobacter sp. OY3WO11]|uniref:hypothetical protein n=1 Tax=Arthrobacter sp. OY3WO11 TaxID=1835723 RepID=UPI0007CF85C3|nr:hypothetical protein [Arthrobacter sp. OY3WO11]OAE01602.1 hypothetical protein A6A22_09360 [Arthrobacter sp. OY3WO11]
MRSRLGIKLTLLASLAVIPVSLTACHGELKLAQSAASKAYQSVGKNTGDITVSESEVSRIASKYLVPTEEVAAVAGQADNYRGWSVPQSRVDKMAQIAKAAKNNEAVSAGVDVACDWMKGEITTQDQFLASVVEAAKGMTDSELQAYWKAVGELADQLTEMMEEGTAKDKAAAALFCYTYSVL